MAFTTIQCRLWCTSHDVELLGFCCLRQAIFLLLETVLSPNSHWLFSCVENTVSQWNYICSFDVTSARERRRAGRGDYRVTHLQHGDNHMSNTVCLIYSCVWIIVAFCKDGCRNGGACIAANVCACPQGFTGPSCETGRTILSSTKWLFSLIHEVTHEEKNASGSQTLALLIWKCWAKGSGEH